MIVLDHLLCVLSDLPSHENPKGVEPFWYPADLGPNAGRSLHFKVVQMQKFFVSGACAGHCVFTVRMQDLFLTSRHKTLQQYTSQ